MRSSKRRARRKSWSGSPSSWAALPFARRAAAVRDLSTPSPQAAAPPTAAELLDGHGRGGPLPCCPHYSCILPLAPFLSLPSFLEPRKLIPLNMAVQAERAVSVARAVSVSVGGAADVVNPRVAPREPLPLIDILFLAIHSSFALTTHVVKPSVESNASHCKLRFPARRLLPAGAAEVPPGAAAAAFRSPAVLPPAQ